MGAYLRDVISLNAAARNFRLMGPDETASNRLDAVFEVTDRVWMERIEPYDVHLAREGRVMEVLSEHLCQGWLEGYLLTGRHGLFSCYEAFIHIVDSMVNQHAKWLKTSAELAWRAPIASLNYLLTSHVWRQDHNGFSHQDPGFADFVANKKADTVRLYFPPDANTLLWVTDHCLRTWNRINVITAGKQPQPQWLTADEAEAHCRAGAGIWEWACTCAAEQRAGRGDGLLRRRADLETLAAVDLLRDALPDLRIRVVNVVDLMTLQSRSTHPHGLTDEAFDRAVHDRPTRDLRLSRLSLPHPPSDLSAQQPRQFPCPRLPGGRHDHHTVRHGGDERDRSFPPGARRHPPRSGLGAQVHGVVAMIESMLETHHAYVREHGEDMPEIRDWRWRGPIGS